MRTKIFLFIFIYHHIIYCQNKNNGCSYPYAYNTLDINNIKAKFYSGGDMHWNIFGNGQNSYEFPKGSGKNAAGSSSLWIGGLNPMGQLKIAAMTYRQMGIDVWPGPLDTVSLFPNPSTCSEFDVAPVINVSDVNAFISDYNNNLTTSSSYSLNQNLQNWAANTTTNTNITTLLAPYHDANNNGLYNPNTEGDYPDISGDQMMYFVMNDKGNVHTETGMPGIGIEVHHSIYAYGCGQTLNAFPELKNAIFHHYRIYNRSAETLTRTVIGMWSSSGIGDNTDDFVGSNPQKGYGYYYNGDNYDNVYGNILPATAIVVLKTPYADNNDLIDNNGNGTIDEPLEQMTVPNVFYYKATMSTFNNPPSSTTEPDIGVHYFNYLDGYWKDGSAFTCGGDAYNGTTSTKHVFPEEVVTGSACNYTWTEKSENNIPGQRSILVCTQPFKLKANSYVEIDYAFVSAIDSTKPNDNWAAVAKLKQEVQKIKNFYQMPVKPSCLLTGIEKIKAGDNGISIYPNPTQNNTLIKSAVEIVSYTISDLYGNNMFNETTVNKNKIEHDFTSYKKGIYFLKIETKKGISVSKIIVN